MKKIVIVITVLAVLALVGLAVFLGASASRSCEVKLATVFSVSADIKSIEQALLLFQLDRGALPKKLSELSPGYLQSLNPDPWNNEYRYRAEENEGARVFSFGADNKRGGFGENADIYADTALGEIEQTIRRQHPGCTN